MGWKDLNYKIKGTIFGFILYILASIVILLSSIEAYFYFFLYLTILKISTFLIAGFLIGWIIDAIKEKSSASIIGLKIGITFSLAVVFFMTYSCYYSSPGYPFSECFFSQNLISNSGIIWIVAFLLLSTFFGWLIGKIKSTRAK